MERDLIMIQKSIDNTIEILQENSSREWHDVLERILDMTKRDYFLKKIKDLIYVYIKTQYYKLLTGAKLYDEKQDLLNLNQRKAYETLSLELLHFVQDSSKAATELSTKS